MAPILIQLLAVLALIPVIGYTVFSYQRSSELVSLSQRNAARMEQVAASVRASLRPVEMNGAVRAPMGEANGQRMAVPAWVVADDRTPWGARFGYCPYSVDATGSAPSPNLTTAAGAVGSGGGTYGVTTARSRGRDYVLQSDAQPIRIRDEAGNETASSTAAQEVVAFIVAPPPFTGDGALPSCSDVVLANGAWIVSPRDGRKPGTVVPVLSRGIATGQVANQGEVVLYADAAARGAGTGDAPSSAIGLKDALDLWHLTPWRAATFRVAGGTYGFGTGDLVPGGTTPRLAFSTPYPGRSLAIVGDGGTLAVANSGGQPIELLFTVDATIDNVAFGEGVVLRVAAGARVTATRSSLRHVRIDGGDLTLGEGTSVSADARANPNAGVVVTSGRLRLAGGTLPLTMGTGAAGIYAMGASWSLTGRGSTWPSRPGPAA